MDIFRPPPWRFLLRRIPFPKPLGLRLSSRDSSFDPFPDKFTDWRGKWYELQEISKGNNKKSQLNNGLGLFTVWFLPWQYNFSLI
jgi:hypothetical protein